jgi:transcriptional regulator with XRE-family HTH domain
MMTGAGMKVGEAFAESIRTTRERQGLSLSDIARRLTHHGWSVDRQTVHRIEQQGRRVSLEEALVFALALEVSLLALLVPFEEDAVEVGAETVPTWLLAGWVTGDEPVGGGGFDWRLRTWRQARRAAEWAAVAQQQSEHTADEDDRKAAGDELEEALRALHQEVELLERNGVTVAGLVPRWLVDDYRRWRSERERGRPLWTIAYWPDETGKGRGTIRNDRGDERDATVIEDGQVRVELEEDDGE